MFIFYHLEFWTIESSFLFNKLLVTLWVLKNKAEEKILSSNSIFSVIFNNATHFPFSFSTLFSLNFSLILFKRSLYS